MYGRAVACRGGVISLGPLLSPSTMLQSLPGSTTYPPPSISPPPILWLFVSSRPAPLARTTQLFGESDKWTTSTPPPLCRRKWRRGLLKSVFRALFSSYFCPIFSLLFLMKLYNVSHLFRANKSAPSSLLSPPSAHISNVISSVISSQLRWHLSDVTVELSLEMTSSSWQSNQLTIININIGSHCTWVATNC